MNIFQSLITTLFISGAISCVTSIHADEDNFYQVYQQSAFSSAAGTPWSSARHVEIVEKANVLRSQFSESIQKKVYPLSEEDLQQVYQNAQSDKVLFFTYSSMIDMEAGAVKAISSEAAATQMPAIAFGIQRTFNREMPAATVEGGWGALKRPNDLAILNVFEKKDAVLNGVVFELPLSDLMILSKREVGYDLIPVIAMRWDDVINGKEPELFLAYTFQAPDFIGQEIRYTNKNINPIPGYFNYLQKGISLFGDDFKAMWWATTYIADQKTLVNELPYHQIDLKTQLAP